MDTKLQRILIRIVFGLSFLLGYFVHNIHATRGWW